MCQKGSPKHESIFFLTCDRIFSLVPPQAVCPTEIWTESNGKVCITLEITITIDFDSLEKNPGRKPTSL